MIYYAIGLGTAMDYSRESLIDTVGKHPTTIRRWKRRVGDRPAWSIEKDTYDKIKAMIKAGNNPTINQMIQMRQQREAIRIQQEQRQQEIDHQQRLAELTRARMSRYTTRYTSTRATDTNYCVNFRNPT